MNPRPFVTISFILLTCAVTFMAPIFDSSIYGINAHPTEWLSFLPNAPLRHSGLSLIFSPFLHINILHLISNLTVFTPVAMMMERKKTGFYLILYFFLVHFQVLLLLSLLHSWIPMEGKAFLGSSHVVIGLYTFWSLASKKYVMLTWPLIVIAIGMWYDNNFTLLAHILGLFIGVELLFLGHLCDKLWSKRSN